MLSGLDSLHSSDEGRLVVTPDSFPCCGRWGLTSFPRGLQMRPREGYGEGHHNIQTQSTPRECSQKAEQWSCPVSQPAYKDRKMAPLPPVPATRVGLWGR